MTQTTAQISCDSTTKEIKNLYANEEGWVSIVPEEYRHSTIENCKELPETLRKFGLDWACELPFKSLFICGTYGSGKTTFAFAIIRRLMQNLRGHGYFWPYYLTGRSLDMTFLKAIRSDDGDDQIIEKYADMDLLFIDDLDKVCASDRFKTQFFDLINRRYISNRTTIITSNCLPKELGELLDGAVLSRISDAAKWKTITFPKKDLRLSSEINF